MGNDELRLENPPIIEAIVDIDCDLPPAFELSAIEADAKRMYSSKYPEFQYHFLETVSPRPSGKDEPVHAVSRKLQSLKFLRSDRQQLIQVRSTGFTFNRLAPYTTLDDYLDELRWAWESYATLTTPVVVRGVRLRFINRLKLPVIENELALEDFLRVGQPIPAVEGLVFTDFFTQCDTVDERTGAQASIAMKTEALEADVRPVIFDIRTHRTLESSPDDWPAILDAIASLRSLKNRIFAYTLTDQCLNLYRSKSE